LLLQLAWCGCVEVDVVVVDDGGWSLHDRGLAWQTLVIGDVLVIIILFLKLLCLSVNMVLILHALKLQLLLLHELLIKLRLCLRLALAVVLPASWLQQQPQSEPDGFATKLMLIHENVAACVGLPHFLNGFHCLVELQGASALLLIYCFSLTSSYVGHCGVLETVSCSS
jgi:hypothetical protein